MSPARWVSVVVAAGWLALTIWAAWPSPTGSPVPGLVVVTVPATPSGSPDPSPARGLDVRLPIPTEGQL